MTSLFAEPSGRYLWFEREVTASASLASFAKDSPKEGIICLILPGQSAAAICRAGAVEA
jgi:hypothetical protein